MDPRESLSLLASSMSDTASLMWPRAELALAKERYRYVMLVISPSKSDAVVCAPSTMLNIQLRTELSDFRSISLLLHYVPNLCALKVVAVWRQQ